MSNIKRDKNGLTEAEFLAQYKPGDYERPSVTVDIMVLRMKEDLSGMQTLLIKRGGHPYIDCWALPGGFVDMKESTYEAAARELEEETGLTDVYLEQIYTMNQPNRDPRTRVMSVLYAALLPYEKNAEVKAGDDAKDALWFDITMTDEYILLENKDRNLEIRYALKKKVFKNGRVTIENYVPVLASEEALAFDHSESVLESLMRMKNKVMYTDVAFNLVPEEFTLPDLQRVYECILGKGLYKANFRDKIAPHIVDLNKTAKPITSHKDAKLYKYKEM